MTLTLQCGHRRECKAGHPHQFRSSEFEERKRCECPIVVAGTLNKKFLCRSTNKWDDARAIATAIETAGSREGEVAPPAPAPEPLPKSTPNRFPIVQANKAFLDEIKEAAAFATHKKYRLLMARMNRFSDERGYVMIDQWEPMDVRQFRSTWPVSPQTAVRRMAMLKPFFEYRLSDKWMESNPARAVKNPKGREMADRGDEQKFPFSDDEIKKMYEACQKYGGTYRHKWDDDMADFVSLSIYTGFRISDAATFHIDRMQASGENRVRTTKAGTRVYTWVRSGFSTAFVHGPNNTGCGFSANTPQRVWT